MKKYLMTFMALLFPLCMSAQLFGDLSNPQKREVEIKTDEIDAEGTRRIICSQRVTYLKQKFIGKTEGNAVAMNLSATKREGEQPNIYLWINVWDFKTSLCIKENSPVLFKLGDDSILRTYVITGDEDNIGKTNFIYVNEYSRPTTMYEVYCAIKVDNEMIEAFKMGLKKIRLEVNNDIYDVNLKKDNISKFLLQEYEMIKAAFNTERSFEEGF